MHEHASDILVVAATRSRDILSRGFATGGSDYARSRENDGSAGERYHVQRLSASLAKGTLAITGAAVLICSRQAGALNAIRVLRVRYRSGIRAGDLRRLAQQQRPRKDDGRETCADLAARGRG